MILVISLWDSHCGFSILNLDNKLVMIWMVIAREIIKFPFSTSMEKAKKDPRKAQQKNVDPKIGEDMKVLRELEK